MRPPGGLESLLAAGRFVVTAELTPPPAADAGALFDRAAPLKGLADALNVTDAAGARTAMSSLAAAAVLVQAGVDTPRPLLWIESKNSEGPSFYISERVSGYVEMRAIFRAEVAPWLRKRCGKLAPFLRRTVQTFGLSELAIDERIVKAEGLAEVGVG